MIDAHLKQRLDSLLDSYDYASHRASDPVSLVHRYRRRDDLEVVGLLASSLAFGRVATILEKTAAVLEALGPSPARFIDDATPRSLRSSLRGFRHRVWRGEHVSSLLLGARRLRREHGTLEAALRLHLEASHGELREALARLADELRGPQPDRGLAHLIPDPRAGSACKRLLLYLRWMIRPADGVDLGVWKLPADKLIIPVDTHVHRISQNLGLTERNDASWRTAEEITERLRNLDPHDPVKYDFAICHLGVSRACPSRRDPELCDTCELRSACRHWKAVRAPEE